MFPLLKLPIFSNHQLFLAEYNAHKGKILLNKF